MQIEVDKRRAFVLLKTDPKKSSLEVMRSLARIAGVEKVFMAEGEWSFVVEVSEGSAEKAKEVASRLKRVRGVREAKDVATLEMR